MVLKDHWELRTEDVRPESLQDRWAQWEGRGVMIMWLGRQRD